ncbi:hypothetical protein [Nonomuraea lactucae]|uniref:hypothetical protein n=1 Tax=Nonomuraea lactucae TaxID=2249762 RepID=UPI000DE39354|nr:hypothetical protein [Nonomuraea lactucae]
MKRLFPFPVDDEIAGMLRAISADHPSDPVFRTRHRPPWRDPANPAEQAMTPFDEWLYHREQKDLN